MLKYLIFSEDDGVLFVDGCDLDLYPNAIILETTTEDIEDVLYSGLELLKKFAP